jgi:hypothetical protein
MDWPTPRNVKEVRSFMGLDGYYRRFIEGFSKIRNPITLLQRKGKRFVWSPECEDSFQQLKQLLTNAHVLRIVDLEKNFLVYIDACKEGISGVLMQEGKVVCHESRNLNEHEQKYVTYDPELAEIVHALKMWRHYLPGRRFILMNEHCGMKYLFD